MRGSVNSAVGEGPTQEFNFLSASYRASAAESISEAFRRVHSTGPKLSGFSASSAFGWRGATWRRLRKE